MPKAHKTLPSRLKLKLREWTGNKELERRFARVRKGSSKRENKDGLKGHALNCKIAMREALDRIQISDTKKRQIVITRVLEFEKHRVKAFYEIDHPEFATTGNVNTIRLESARLKRNLDGNLRIELGREKANEVMKEYFKLKRMYNIF